MQSIINIIYLRIIKTKTKSYYKKQNFRVFFYTSSVFFSLVCLAIFTSIKMGDAHFQDLYADLLIPCTSKYPFSFLLAENEKRCEFSSFFKLLDSKTRHIHIWFWSLQIGDQNWRAFGKS